MRPDFSLRRLRAAHITTAAVLLAAPSTALALTDADAAAVPPTLPMHVSARNVALGHAVTVAGHVGAADAGTTVELQSAPTGTRRWRLVTSTRVGRDGGWTLHAHLRESSLLRAVALVGSPSRPAVSAPGSGGPVAVSAAAASTTAVSRATPVAVRARLQVPDRQRSVVAGQRGLLVGHLLPGRAGRLVAVQVRVGSGWRTIARRRTGRWGGFRIAFAPPTGIGRALRVVFGGDRFNAGALLTAGSVTLYTPAVVSWYDDAGDTACGFHATYGVASRTLPCGTQVRFRYGDRAVTATVDDRGPYVYSREYDLDQTTAGALGFDGVATMQTSVG